MFYIEFFKKYINIAFNHHANSAFNWFFGAFFFDFIKTITKIKIEMSVVIDMIAIIIFVKNLWVNTATNLSVEGFNCQRLFVKTKECSFNQNELKDSFEIINKIRFREMVNIEPYANDIV